MQQTGCTYATSLCFQMLDGVASFIAIFFFSPKQVVHSLILNV